MMVDIKDSLTMRRPKVLFIPRWYPNSSNYADGRPICEQAKAASINNDVIVLYEERKTKHSIKGLKLFEILSDKSEEGIRTIRTVPRRFPLKGCRHLIASYVLSSQLKRLEAEEWVPDVIHFHVHSAAVLFMRLLRRLRKPVIVTEHWSGFIRHSLKPGKIKAAKKVLNGVDLVIAVSSYLEKELRSYGISNEIVVLPNTVDTELFRPSQQAIDGKIKKLLFVGYLNINKGIDTLLYAIAKIHQNRKDFQLDIVGDSDDRADYEKIAKQLDIIEIVKFHGFKGQREVAEFMRNCSFYVQPSHNETFGVTYIEAMSSGKPVIGTKIPVLEEKINNERGLLVEVGNTDSLAEAIDYMLNHFKDFSAGDIRKYAVENYSFAAVGKRLDAIYRSFIKLK